jgi:hypothetical protein
MRNPIEMFRPKHLFMPLSVAATLLMRTPEELRDRIKKGLHPTLTILDGDIVEMKADDHG